jgi:plastocyanin
MRRLLAFVSTLALTTGLVLVPATHAQAKPSLRILSPTEGTRVTSTDIPVQLEVSSFSLSAADVGLPDVNGEGHIHVMLDGMNMGVLFNFFTTPTFTLLGDAIPPGRHTLIFDLASNTHMDMEDTVQHVTIDYQPTNPRPAPAMVANPGPPTVKVTSPADGAAVDPKFTLQVDKTNFSPSLGLEGKPDQAGFGHYHVMVDMDVFPMMMMGGMMAMDGMVAMPGSDTIPLDLSAWPPGKHTITVEPVQNDHTPIEGATPGMITINLQGTSAAPRAMDGLTLLGQDAATQTIFNVVWGDRAGERWSAEHNHQLESEMGAGMPMPAAPAPAAPAPAPAAPAPAAATMQVQIVEPAFQPSSAWMYSPDQVSVKTGQPVKWTNSGAVAHTVTADDGTSFDSGTIAPGATFTLTPSTAGTFAYHCSFHPWMKGTLTATS